MCRGKHVTVRAESSKVSRGIRPGRKPGIGCARGRRARATELRSIVLDEDAVGAYTLTRFAQRRGGQVPRWCRAPRGGAADNHTGIHGARQRRHPATARIRRCAARTDPSRGAGRFFTPRRRPSRVRDVILCAMFDEDDVAPSAVMLADAVASADFAESCGAVECGAGGVLREDAGLDGPDSGVCGGRDQRVE